MILPRTSVYKRDGRRVSERRAGLARQTCGKSAECTGNGRRRRRGRRAERWRVFARLGGRCGAGLFRGCGRKSKNPKSLQKEPSQWGVSDLPRGKATERPAAVELCRVTRGAGWAWQGLPTCGGGVWRVGGLPLQGLPTAGGGALVCVWWGSRLAGLVGRFHGLWTAGGSLCRCAYAVRRLCGRVEGCGGVEGVRGAGRARQKSPAAVPAVWSMAGGAFPVGGFCALIPPPWAESMRKKPRINPGLFFIPILSRRRILR